MLILTNASRIFAERCVEGIEADRAMCEHWLERSPAIVTALAPRIGYAAAAQLAKEAVARNLTVRQLDRKSTRLNSSHSQISYAVFCLKKKKTNKTYCSVVYESRVQLRGHLQVSVAAGEHDILTGRHHAVLDLAAGDIMHMHARDHAQA